MQMDRTKRRTSPPPTFPAMEVDEEDGVGGGVGGSRAVGVGKVVVVGGIGVSVMGFVDVGVDVFEKGIALVGIVALVSVHQLKEEY